MNLKVSVSWSKENSDKVGLFELQNNKKEGDLKRDDL